MLTTEIVNLNHTKIHSETHKQKTNLKIMLMSMILKVLEQVKKLLKTMRVEMLGPVAKKGYQAVGFPCNRMLKLSSSRGIRIDVPVLSVSWSFEDHSVNIKALRKGLIEHEASDTGGAPRWKSSCRDRLAEATISTYFSELCWRSLAEESCRCCRLQQTRPLLGVRRT